MWQALTTIIDRPNQTVRIAIPRGHALLVCVGNAKALTLCPVISPSTVEVSSTADDPSDPTFPNAYFVVAREHVERFLALNERQVANIMNHVRRVAVGVRRTAGNA
jgi:hypothetical protein